MGNGHDRRWSRHAGIGAGDSRERLKRPDTRRTRSGRKRGLSNWRARFTALRREQSPSRAGLQEIEPFQLPSGRVIQRISPLAPWTTKDVWDYARSNEIPLLPLYDKGYTSIGCEPCTTLPLDPSNPRSGRWQGQKLECGIHLQSK